MITFPSSQPSPTPPPDPNRDACPGGKLKQWSGQNSSKPYKAPQHRQANHWEKPQKPSNRNWRQQGRQHSTSPPVAPHTALGKAWWNNACHQAVQVRRRAWSQWRRSQTPQAGKEYQRLDAICAKTILQHKRKAWDSHCSSLSFSSNTKRTWDFLHAMAGKTRHPVSVSSPTHSDLDDQGKAEVLASHYRLTIGVAPILQPPRDLHTNIL